MKLRFCLSKITFTLFRPKINDFQRLKITRDRWTGGRTDGWTVGQTDGWTDRQTDGLINGPMDTASYRDA